MKFAKSYIDKARDYVSDRVTADMSQEEITQVMNDSANIFASSYSEYESIWHALLNP